VADVTLCGDVHGDLELIARSGPTVLPELGYIRWDQIQQPPKGPKLKKRAG
jgi:hypothetical protein